MSPVKLDENSHGKREVAPLITRPTPLSEGSYIIQMMPQDPLGIHLSNLRNQEGPLPAMTGTAPQ